MHLCNLDYFYLIIWGRFLKILCGFVGISILIFLSGCGSSVAGEENLPSECLKYKSKAQEILQPFPDMLNEMEQTMLDVNNKLSDATPKSARLWSKPVKRC